MNSAESNKSTGSNKSSNCVNSKPIKRGTSSFCSRVPRFPNDKTRNGPSPGQYDPVVKEKIKGIVPLNKQLPRTRNLSYPADTSKITRIASNSRSKNSSSMNSRCCTPTWNRSTSRSNTPKSTSNSQCSHHDSSKRSSSCSNSGSHRSSQSPTHTSKSPTRYSKQSSTNDKILVPFAPPKQYGIVNTSPSEAIRQRQKSAFQLHQARNEEAKNIRSHTYAKMTWTNPQTIPRVHSSYQRSSSHPQTRPHTANIPTQHSSHKKSSSRGENNEIRKHMDDVIDHKLVTDAPLRPAESSPAVSRSSSKCDSSGGLGRTCSSCQSSLHQEGGSDRTALWHCGLFSVGDNIPPPSDPARDDTDDSSSDSDDHGNEKTGTSPITDFMSDYYDNELGMPHKENAVAKESFKIAQKELHATASYSSNMYAVFRAGVFAAKKMNAAIGDNMATEVQLKECTSLPSKNEKRVNLSSRSPSPSKHATDRVSPSRKLVCRPNSPTKEAPKPRTCRSKSRENNTLKKVNEAESFPKVDPKKKSSSANVVQSCITPANDVPQVILQKGHKYYVPGRSMMPKVPAKESCTWTKLKRRSRTQDTERDHPHVTFKPRSQSMPTEAESVSVGEVIDSIKGRESVEQKEVEISSTIYDEEPPQGFVDSEDGADRSDMSTIGIDIDFVCSNNNLTVYADIDAAHKNKMEETRLSASSSKQFVSQPKEKSTVPDHRPADSKPRSKSIPKLGLKTNKSNTRSHSAGDAYKSSIVPSKDDVAVSEEERFARDSRLMTTVEEYESNAKNEHCEQLSRTLDDSRCSECQSDISSINTAETSSTVRPTAATTDPPRYALPELEEKQTEEDTINKFPKLSLDMCTNINRPACHYVRDSSSLLEGIPLTAQHISDSFQKMLDGLRSYLTLPPFINMKRSDHLEQMMAFVNEADGNAFYIRQEVKTELKKCVSLITNNLHMLLALNETMEEDRRRAQRKIDEMLLQNEKQTEMMDKYMHQLELEQKKADDWAYKCRKEQEKKRFVAGSKELVEKEAAQQKKELREAEEEVSTLKKEIREFEKKLEEMKVVALHKDAKFAAKLKQDEIDTQANAEILAQCENEKMAIQRTCRQMSESHIRENNINMVRIQELEKLLVQAEERILSVQNENKEIEKQLQKKDDYLKLVEGATVNLVRQTNPGREMPSMPQDFGLSPREVTVWEQLELCRGRLSDLEAENSRLQEQNSAITEKMKHTDSVYQWVQQNEKTRKGHTNEFTILEQPNAELVAEMEDMRKQNKILRDKVAAKEKHCNLAHGKIAKLQELLNSLRISASEDADRVEIATQKQQINELKTSMREMMVRFKEMDMKCTTQEIQLKQRDFHNENQQRLLETRNQVIQVLMAKGRDVSTIDNFMGFGDIFRPAASVEESEMTTSKQKLTCEVRKRMLDLESMVTTLEDKML